LSHLHEKSCFSPFFDHHSGLLTLSYLTSTQLPLQRAQN
jgi:hypothetical protein